MQNDYVKLRHTRDIVGTEICGAIKNVIAIASGMLDGMGYPISTSSMFITESLHDIKALIKALGGNKKLFFLSQVLEIFYLLVLLLKVEIIL